MTTTTRILGAVAGIAVVGGSIWWLSGGFTHRVAPGTVAVATAEAPGDAALAEVKQVTGPVYEWSSGAVASARQTVIAPRILARIEQITVHAGDTVAAGDLLVKLDARDFETRVAQAREAVQAAQARRDLAASEKTRIEQLLARGVATQQRLDQAVAEYRSASAEVDRLEQSLREAQTALSYTRITAPAAGVVVDRLAEPGDTAAPGSPILRIYDPATLRIEVPVRESLAVQLKTGDEIGFDIPSLKLRSSGKIEEIVPFAEPGARTLLVKVSVASAPGIYAGLFARVAIPDGSRTRLLIPASAVERVGQLDFVTVVGPERRAERRLVTLGAPRSDGTIEALSGLAPGERVLAKPGK